MFWKLRIPLAVMVSFFIISSPCGISYAADAGETTEFVNQGQAETSNENGGQSDTGEAGVSTVSQSQSGQNDSSGGYLDSTMEEMDTDKSADTSGKHERKKIESLKTSGGSSAAGQKSGASSVTNPFAKFSGNKKPEEAGQNSTGQPANVPIPVPRPADLKVSSGAAASTTSFDQDRKDAWAVLKRGIKNRSKKDLEEAEDRYEKLVFATSGESGKFLYFLGRAKEELSYITNDKKQAKDANDLFKKAAAKLKAKPDETKTVSVKDAESKIDTVGSETAGSGEFGGVWPYQGRITSKFGMRNCPFHGRENHKGVDIAVPMNSTLKAIGNGKVVLSQKSRSGFGNTIVVEHNINGKKYYTRYAHLATVCPVGTAVTRGQSIPGVKSDTTGSSTGPHLHFEIREGSINGTPLNPTRYFGILSK